MFPRAEARRASRVRRLGKERAALLHHYGRDHSETRSGTASPPNMKRLGPSGSGGGGGAGTCFRMIPAVVVKKGCSFFPPATNAARAPGFSTRKHSAHR